MWAELSPRGRVFPPRSGASVSPGSKVHIKVRGVAEELQFFMVYWEHWEREREVSLDVSVGVSDGLLSHGAEHEGSVD